MFVDNDGIQITDPTVSSCERFQVAYPMDEYGVPFIEAVVKFTQKPWIEVINDDEMWHTIATYQGRITPPFEHSFDEPEYEEWLDNNKDNRDKFARWVFDVLLRSEQCQN